MAAKKKATKKAPKGKKKSTKEDVVDSVQEILDGLRSDAGSDDVAFRMSDDGHGLAVSGSISTRCYGLDKSIGVNGLPLSRLVILHGPEASGKTTICLQAAAECQAKGGIVLYLDKEYKLDPSYARKLGVDMDRLILSQPPTLEMAFKLMAGAIKRRDAIAKKTGQFIPLLIVLDSMNAAITKAQLEGEYDASHYAPQARVFSQSLPKIMPAVNKSDTTMLFVSQVRKKMVTFGNDEDIAGGNAPKFYAALIIHVKKIGTFKVGDEKVGNKTVSECKKNQVGVPFKKAEFIIRYGFGVDNEVSIIDAAVKAKALVKKGAWYWSGKDKEAEGFFKMGPGLLKAAALLREHDEWRERIMDKIDGKVGEVDPDDIDDDDDDEDDDV